MHSFYRQLHEHRVFTSILQMIPGLEDRLLEGSNEDILHVGELVRVTMRNRHHSDIVATDTEGLS